MATVSTGDVSLLVAIRVLSVAGQLRGQGNRTCATMELDGHAKVYLPPVSRETIHAFTLNV